MPIAAFINDALGIRIHRFSGAVTPAELYKLAGFYDGNRALVRTDVVSLVDAKLQDTRPLLLPELDALRQRFKELHIAADFVLLRRSAWVCPHPGALALLQAWLHGRHSHDGQGTELCLVAALPEISDLFEPDEIAAISEQRGFRDLFTIG